MNINYLKKKIQKMNREDAKDFISIEDAFFSICFFFFFGEMYMEKRSNFNKI